MDRYQLMAVIEKRIDNSRLEYGLLEPTKSGAGDYAFGYGYMSSWLAALALKHPAVMQEMLEDSEFVKAQESLKNSW